MPSHESYTPLDPPAKLGFSIIVQYTGGYHLPLFLCRATTPIVSISLPFYKHLDDCTFSISGDYQEQDYRTLVFFLFLSNVPSHGLQTLFRLSAPDHKARNPLLRLEPY